MTNNPDHCINPSEITQEGLIAYALGEGAAGVADHVRRCAFCQAEAGGYAKASATLSSGLRRASCLPSLTIGEYALGTLTGVELQQAAAHLADCPLCLAESRQFSAFLAQGDAPAVGILETIRRLLLRPIAAPSPALAGLRGSATESTIYADAEQAFQVHVRVEPAGPGRRDKVITGLVEAPGNAGQSGKVALYRGDRLIQSDELDAGNFFFGSVSAGSYRLEIALEQTLAVVDSIEVA